MKKTWKIDESEELPLGVIEDTEEGMGIAEICPNKDQKANAKLIAAAPELLEACKKAIDFLPHTSGNWGLSEREMRLFDVLYAAISKATS